MNRTDRLLAIVLELQGKGRQRAEDLAHTFETSKRTIYRDMLALSEAGVPLISTPGQGYSLMQGYFLPPLSFTTEEATMLLLGSDFMAQNFDAQYRNAARSAARKIEGVLPATLHDEVHYLQSSIHFVAAGSPNNISEREKLQMLRRSIIERHRVSFSYHTRHSENREDGPTDREADPYALLYLSNAWQLIAFCHLRQGKRVFRLDRMEHLTLLPQTFQRPPNFLVQPEQNKTRNVLIRALFDSKVARWVRESRPFHVTAEEDTANGLLVTLLVRQESEVIQWLLSWGSHVQVLEPDSLRARIADEARALIQNHQSRE